MYSFFGSSINSCHKVYAPENPFVFYSLSICSIWNLFWKYWGQCTAPFFNFILFENIADNVLYIPVPAESNLLWRFMYFCYVSEITTSAINGYKSLSVSWGFCIPNREVCLKTTLVTFLSSNYSSWTIKSRPRLKGKLVWSKSRKRSCQVPFEKRHQ